MSGRQLEGIVVWLPDLVAVRDRSDDVSGAIEAVQVVEVERSLYDRAWRAFDEFLADVRRSRNANLA